MNLRVRCSNSARGCPWVGTMETLNQHVAQSCSYTTRCHRRCNRIFVTTVTNLKFSVKVHEVMRTVVDPRALLSEELLFQVGSFHLILEGNCLEFKLISSVLEFEFGVFIMPGRASVCDGEGFFHKQDLPRSGHGLPLESALRQTQPHRHYSLLQWQHFLPA